MLLQYLGSLLFYFFFFFFFLFFFLTTKCLTGSLLLRGENMTHLTLISFMAVQFPRSLWIIFVHRVCSKYWLQCNQMDRARVRKTNPFNYFYSFITDLVIFQQSVSLCLKVKLFWSKEIGNSEIQKLFLHYSCLQNLIVGLVDFFPNAHSPYFLNVWCIP